MASDLFRAFELYGVCEVHLIIRDEGYCDRRARWYHTTTGYLLCGTHKRELERGRASAQSAAN